MASIYQLKPAFQGILRPLVGSLARARVTPNQVTLAALALSFAAGAAIALRPGARWPLLLLPAVLLARMALNAIDGMLAREHGLTTPLGAVLNELGDVLSDAALYLPLTLVPGVPGTLVVAAVFLATVSEMAGVVAVQIGTRRRYDGPMGKSDRAFVIGVIGLAVGLGASPGIWLDATLAAVVGLLGVTIWRRARAALRELGT